MPPPKILQSFWAPVVTLTDSDFVRLETIAGVLFSAALRDRIAHNLQQYAQDTAMRAAALRPAAVRDPLATINHLATALRKTMSRNPRTNPGGAAAVRLIQQKALLGERLYLSIDEMRRTLVALERYSAAALLSLPTDSGREGDPYADPFLLAMHSLFSEAGGRGIYTPASLGFLEAAYQLAGGELQSREALSQRLKQARNVSFG